VRALLIEYQGTHRTFIQGGDSNYSTSTSLSNSLPQISPWPPPSSLFVPKPPSRESTPTPTRYGFKSSEQSTLTDANGQLAQFEFHGIFRELPVQPGPDQVVKSQAPVESALIDPPPSAVLGHME